MSGIATLIRKLAGENGIEIDGDEFESIFGEALSTSDPDLDHTTAMVGETLSAEAAGAVEIFLSEPRTWLAAPVQETDGLMWEPIIREGQWAVRPGPNGQKSRRPLKVVAGRSKDQRKEIGLQDLVDAFDQEAIEHVTVPTSHENDVTQNTGFIKGLKLVDGEYKVKGAKTKKKVKVLMGGYDIKLPDIKKKMQLGAIASRSAGLLYDYVDTERGKTWPVVLEHVALTNKPWITGMKTFGRQLVKKVKSTVGLSLSDVEPSDEDLLAQEDALESIELAAGDNSITWDKEDDPDWLRAQVSCRLTEARAKKVAALPQGKAGLYVYGEYPPNYRCVKARPGLALIADGWGDEANMWTAPISVTEGEVVLDDDLDNWTPSKRVYIADSDRPKGFETGEEPLSEGEKTVIEEVTLDPLQLAQQARLMRAGVEPPKNDPTIHPRGGEDMAVSAGATELQLSDEARQAIEAADARAAAAEKKASESDKKLERLSEQVTSLLGGAAKTRADEFITTLKGIGLSEENGFTGMLVEVRQAMLADDGQPAVQGEHFADEANDKGILSLSDVIERIFGAIEKGEDGKVKLGTQLSQPSEKTTTTTEAGKPAKDDPKVEKEVDFSDLSADEQTAHLYIDNPEVFGSSKLSDEVKAIIERLKSEATTNGNGSGEGAK